MKIHVVTSGDTLYSIAVQYGTTIDRLIADNQMPNPNQLAIGQTILIRIPQIEYTVKSGDTLSRIASQNNLSIRQLWRNNPGLQGKSNLTPGQSLVLSYDDSPSKEICSMGYAYPNISSDLYQSVLPYLTAVAPFTHSVDEGGNLSDLEDEKLVQSALNMGTAPLLHISTLIQETGFSGSLARSVLTGQTAKENLISQIISTATQKGYRGVDLDFEGVFGENAADFAQFVTELKSALTPYRLPVIVALAPKTAADQKGVTYEGHNYALLGAAADFLLLMTYEWGYTYSAPRAVSPITGVRQVVDFAVSQIPPKKLLLGLPNYGYDWTLPHVQGNRARSISCQEAVDLAAQNRVSIRYDEGSQTPWFRYSDQYGTQHEVWFEDCRSIQQKLNLVREFNLGGVSYWNLDRAFPQTYPLLNGTFLIQDYQ